MTVIGYDPVMDKHMLAEAGIAHASLADIYKRSDFITVSAVSDWMGRVGRTWRLC